MLAQLKYTHKYANNVVQCPFHVEWHYDVVGVESKLHKTSRLLVLIFIFSNGSYLDINCNQTYIVSYSNFSIDSYQSI